MNRPGRSWKLWGALTPVARLLTFRPARRCTVSILYIIGAVVVIIVILRLLGLW